MNAQKYSAILQTQKLCVGYTHAKERIVIAQDIECEIFEGEMLCLLGPNGSGKSTLIRTIAGLQAPLAGSIRIHGEEIAQKTAGELSKNMSVVLTDSISIPNTTVWDVVSLGRYPHTNWLGLLREIDTKIIAESIEKVGLAHYAHRNIGMLSDGEKQRAMIAKALAQDTDFIVLDEPTAHLDLPNRIAIMKLLRDLAHSTRKSILLSTHELDLALQVADRIWLMQKNAPMLCGMPEDLVLNGSFQRIFSTDACNFDVNTGFFKITYPVQHTVSLHGEQPFVLWTTRALYKYGIAVREKNPEIPHICIEQGTWCVEYKNQHTQCRSIFELLSALRFS
ncbi:MAG: ABC transporter ATP-binding protein [Bacteroidales bacterium]|jgi:iron complex transport system ATP-binding protein|nr:ABC transporter ATP-binding protein [Bacteroidales bacterium]